jgi:hypothetical protein
MLVAAEGAAMGAASRMPMCEVPVSGLWASWDACR